MTDRKALLLLAFGGPRSLDEVEPFLTRLFKGRRRSQEQLATIKDRYRLIGGASPLYAITESQAHALENRLNARGLSVKSYIGMRYTQPLIEDVLKQVLQEGFRTIIALPLAPFRSKATTGAYLDELNRAKASLEEGIETTLVLGWSRHALFLEAVREKIREALAGFALEERERVHLIFSAHSLPKSLIEGDPYVEDFEACVREVTKGIETLPWHMAFQSKGGGNEEWAGPDVEFVMEKLSTEGVRKVLLIPIGFVSDHIEILYDIDYVFQKKAESLGMTFKRTSSLNVSDKFIEALADAVEEKMRVG